MINDETVIEHTKNWVQKVVIGLNFCPFASREWKRDGIFYTVIREEGMEKCVAAVVAECERLDKEESIGTTLLIFSEYYAVFDDFLELLNKAEKRLLKLGYEGVYQIASFHPDYCFEGESPDDPANFTNKSPYPMLHLLREESLEKAIDYYPDPENIPERNILLARKKGFDHLKALRDSCFL